MNALIHRFTVGHVHCAIIPDGVFAYEHPAAVFFAGAPPAELEQALLAHQIDPSTWTYYHSPYPTLLIDTGRERLLVDTGAGNLAPTTGQLLAHLHAADIAPESIDTIILSHGHADHVGGNVAADGSLVFPHARYVMWRSEWDFWKHPDMSPLHIPEEIKQALIGVAQRNLSPLADRIELLDQECEITPGVRAIAAPGHTPGHMALLISSQNEQLLYLVDTVLHPIHMEHPEWVAAIDLLPEQTVATRRKLLAHAAAERMQVFAFHFPAPGLGYVVTNGDAWRWQPIE